MEVLLERLSELSVDVWGELEDLPVDTWGDLEDLLELDEEDVLEEAAVLVEVLAGVLPKQVSLLLLVKGWGGG